ncbi:MAG: hypothetical protein UW32_C0001G0029 [Candidatus Wolfebacteria bacterium GW2011_GWE2_44_13]|uniref:Uncharacterized protein n=1 Tax=Candidatus Wolfebacteria bacterium GW2011_GWE2_44_13 TaxID=1619017 RepID=A0A0G1JHF1_9BACT|nr:MAG: hypothetical protein UW32_C0001G0029 [Candidatus Wolfebacteria bacterium GW2011_GWE2_44_13]
MAISALLLSFVNPSLSCDVASLTLPTRQAVKPCLNTSLPTDFVILSGDFDIRRFNELRAAAFNVASERNFAQSAALYKQVEKILNSRGLEQNELEEAVSLETLAGSLFHLATWQYDQYQEIQGRLQATASQ